MCSLPVRRVLSVLDSLNRTNSFEWSFENQLFLVVFCFQAAKPKHSVSEKENNPVKSAEALPDAKKMEYRLLRDDMARCVRSRIHPRIRCFYQWCVTGVSVWHVEKYLRNEWHDWSVYSLVWCVQSGEAEVRPAGVGGGRPVSRGLGLWPGRPGKSSRSAGEVESAQVSVHTWVGRVPAGLKRKKQWWIFVVFNHKFTSFWAISQKTRLT